jgi:hypothetical protein
MTLFIWISCPQGTATWHTKTSGSTTRRLVFGSTPRPRITIEREAGVSEAKCAEPLRNWELGTKSALPRFDNACAVTLAGC